MIERSVANPLQLLTDASAILQRLNLAGLLPLRRQLTRDIEALRAVAGINREDIYVQLEALIERTSNLPLLEPPKPAESSASPDVVDGSDVGWLERLSASAKRALQSFDGYLRIRQHDQPIKPLLGPDQEQFVRHNLRMRLVQAQLALLRGEQSIYRAGLEASLAMLASHFPAGDQRAEFERQLLALAERPIVERLPVIQGSLDALERYLQTAEENH